MAEERVEEILQKTKDYFCFGVDDDCLRIRIKTAMSIPPGGIVIDYGTGQGRVAMVMAMANPLLSVFTFEIGRSDLTDTQFMERTLSRIRYQKLNNIIFGMGEGTEMLPGLKQRIAILNIDVDGQKVFLEKSVKRWFRQSDNIFIQNYKRDKYPDVKEVTDKFLSENKDYKLVGLYDDNAYLKYVQA